MVRRVHIRTRTLVRLLRLMLSLQRRQASFSGSSSFLRRIAVIILFRACTWAPVCEEQSGAGRGIFFLLNSTGACLLAQERGERERGVQEGPKSTWELSKAEGHLASRSGKGRSGPCLSDHTLSHGLAGMQRKREHDISTGVFGRAYSEVWAAYFTH